MGSCSPTRNCTMTVGAPAFAALNGGLTRSFRGWVDELRVYKLRSADIGVDSGFEEQICNFALGTLVNGASSHVGIVQLRSRLVVAVGNSRVPTTLCEQLVRESTSEPFDYARQYGRTLCASRVHASVQSPDCIRSTRLSLPDLSANSERPSSANNNFCLSCHSDLSNIDGLRVRALQTHAENPLIAAFPRYQDPRRQPLNAPALIALPRHDCTVGELNQTYYSVYPNSASILYSNGLRTQDHVFDDAPQLPTGYLPPGPN